MTDEVSALGPSARSARPSGVRAMIRLGLVSDTHGWLDPRVLAAFAAEMPLAGIVHAGDIGDVGIIDDLEMLAPPVTAVLGNCDYGHVPGMPTEKIARATVAGKSVLVVHDFAGLGPIPDDVDVVVRGHSHTPAVQWRDGVLIVNPGSASQRRHQPGCTVGVLEIDASGDISARIIELDEFGERAR